MTARPSYSNYSTSFPLGRYKGGKLQDIPSDYLMWVLRETNPRIWLEEAIRAELRSRGAAGEEDQPHTWQKHQATLPKHVDPDVVAEIVDAGKRPLSLQHHPDLGGDLAAMQEINVAADWLREHLAGVSIGAGVWLIRPAVQGV